MTTKESTIEMYLVQQLKKHNMLCLKFISPSVNGVPDRILIGYGKVIFIETKRPGETLRELQKIIIDEMRLHGAEVHVIDTKQKVDQLIAKIVNK